MKIYTWRNRPLTQGEFYDPSIPSQRSLTVPDQSLTISELIGRYTRGQSLPGDIKEESGYDLESEVPLELPDLEKLDKLEKAQLSKDIEEEKEKVIERAKDRKKKVESDRQKVKVAKERIKKGMEKINLDEKKD